MRALAWFWLMLSCSASVRADEPLIGDDLHVIRGDNPQCFARSERATNTTSAYAIDARGTLQPLWTLPGFYRIAALSHDCAYLVTGRDGGNLLPLDYARDTVLLSFYRAGRLHRQLYLHELIHDLRALHRTDSHWDWGAYVGGERKHYYRITTVERGAFVFDMHTGLVVSEP